MPNFTLIAAVSDNNIIGKSPDIIPWEKIPEDRKRFKRLTMEHPVLMGRKTYESIPEKFRPLSGRKNIVVSRRTNQEDYPEEIIICDSVHKAIDEATRLDQSFYVMGGGQIYMQTINLANRLEITEVHQTVEGDVFFPSIYPHLWEETQRDDFEEYSFVTYKLRSN